MTTASHTRPPKMRDPLIAELLEGYGIATERELRSRLKAAQAWADKHAAQFNGVSDGEADGLGLEIGPEVSRVDDGHVRRMCIEIFTDDKAIKAPAHRRLLKAASALFLYTHPVTRRHIEAGRHSRC